LIANGVSEGLKRPVRPGYAEKELRGGKNQRKGKHLQQRRKRLNWEGGVDRDALVVVEANWRRTKAERVERRGK